VALSGGGYRAALMHAGVLQGLEELKIPVTNISAVSGGSITAAYYAVGGVPRGVLNALIFRQFNTPRDFFDIQNAARLLLSAPVPGTHVRLLPDYSFGRTDVQAKALDRVLLNSLRFKDLPASAPNLMVCVTDLNSGSALGLTSGWRITRFLLRPPGEELFPNVRSLYAHQPRVAQSSSFAALDSRETRLSKAVAASGAFPLAFEPVPLRTQAGNFLMTDGGVSDNSGMTLLLEADRRASLPKSPQGQVQGDKDWALDMAISVDGGAMFQRSSANPDLTSVDAAGRAVDIIHSRLGATKPAEPRDVGHNHGPAAVLLSPSLYMDNSRNYDYTKIAMASFDGLADLRGYASRSVHSLLSTARLSAEQQQLFNLVARQVATMDRDSLQLLLVKLEGVQPGYYGDLLQRLDKSWLTEEESGVLQVSVSDRHVDMHALDAINQKRMQRMQTLKSISLRVAEDLSVCLATFVETPTLEDNISVRDAKRIFRLGQYLALLNASQLREPLATPTTNGSAARITRAEKDNVVCVLEAITKYGREEQTFGGDQKAQEAQQHRRFQQLRETANAEFESCLARDADGDPALQADLSHLHFTF